MLGAPLQNNITFQYASSYMDYTGNKIAHNQVIFRVDNADVVLLEGSEREQASYKPTMLHANVYTRG